MVSVGTLVWISCRPLLKMVICTASGFILSRMDLFSAMAARGAGQVMLNVTIPSLLFSKMVPSINSTNIKSMGPLIVMGALYQSLGLLVALVTKQIFWVPHRFRNGIIVAGVWGNVGDVPTAVILSITSTAPFSSGDGDLGIAYLAGFLLIFTVTLFPMGGHHLIAKDFEGPELEDEEVKELLRLKQHKQRAWLLSLIKNRRRDISVVKSSSEKAASETDIIPVEIQVVDEEADIHVESSLRPRHHHNHVSFDNTPTREGVTVVIPTERERNSHQVMSPATSTYGGADPRSPNGTMVAPTEKDFKEKTLTFTEPERSSSPNKKRTILSRTLDFIRISLTPVTLSMLLSFPIALIKPLRGLFLVMDNSPIPLAPDGRPPLYFILDTTQFLGAASVPLGLVCLGAALAKLKVPKTINALPIGAIISMVVGKLIISPIVGVLVVHGFVKIGFINPDDKVLRFVAIFLSCMPTATTQVFLTQVYSGTGEAEHLSAFLIPQYLVMLVSITVLTAYILHLLF